MSKTYAISEEHYEAIKKFARNFAYHDRDCGMHPSNMMSLEDYCTCGYSDWIAYLKKKEATLKEIDPSKILA
jgi:hypothetical protein